MNKSTLLFLMLSVSTISLSAMEAPRLKIVAPASPNKFERVKSTSSKEQGPSGIVKQTTQEKVAATRETSADQVEALQKQIEALQKQLEAISKQVKEQSQQVREIKSEHKQIKEQPTATTSAVVKEETKQQEDMPKFDKGYIPVPGTKAAVKFEGLVKLDAIVDGKNSTGDYTLMSNLPYNLQSRNPNNAVTGPTNRHTWKRHFNMHAKQTKLGIRSLVKNNSGKDIEARIEFDMYGTQSLGDTYPAYGATAGPANITHTPRIRHATLSYGGLMAGHTWTNFFDFLETVTQTVDFGSLNGPGRRAQIRYTHKFDHIEAAISAEQPRADYVTYNNTPAGTALNYAYFQQNTTGNLSKAQRPDFAFSLKYKANNGNVLGTSVLVRDLTIKNNNIGATINANSDGRTYKASGYGFNIAAKVMTVGKSYVTTGVAFGKGIGWYIGDLNGRSALLDISDSSNGVRTYKSIPMSMAWLGYTHIWNDQWQTSVGGSQADLSTSGSMYNRTITRSVDPGLDRQMRRVMFNTIYKPEENLEFGLEYMYLKRKSVLKYRGEGSRYQFGASYKF